MLTPGGFQGGRCLKSRLNAARANYIKVQRTGAARTPREATFRAAYRLITDNAATSFSTIPHASLPPTWRLFTYDLSAVPCAWKQVIGEAWGARRDRHGPVRFGQSYHGFGQMAELERVILSGQSTISSVADSKARHQAGFWSAVESEDGTFQSPSKSQASFLCMLGGAYGWLSCVSCIYAGATCYQ